MHKGAELQSPSKWTETARSSAHTAVEGVKREKTEKDEESNQRTVMKARYCVEYRHEHTLPHRCII